MPEQRRRPATKAAWVWISFLLASGTAAIGASRTHAAETATTGGPVSITLEPPTGLPAELVGRPVVRLDIVTLGGRWQTEERVRRTPLAQPLSHQFARDVMRELMSTGRYAEARADAVAMEGGALLRVTVLPRRIVIQLKATGSPLGAAATLEAAEVEPGADVTVHTLSEVERRVLELHRDAGYPNAVVDAQALDTDEPMNVVLHLRVQPGEPLLISQRQVQIHPRPTPDSAALTLEYPGRAGSRADLRVLRRADRELANRLRARGYPDAEVRHVLTPSPDGARLSVDVYPGARTVLHFRGNDHFDSQALRARIEEEPEFDVPTLLRKLENFYVRRGFLDAKVAVERRDAPDGSRSDYWFDVHENQRVVVRARHFPCLTGERSRADLEAEIDGFLSEALPGSSLLGPADPGVLNRHLTPRTGGAGPAPLTLDPWQTYDPAVYEQALENLRALYRSEGYLSAEVGPAHVVRRACDPRSPPGACQPVGPRKPPPISCAGEAEEAAAETQLASGSCPLSARGASDCEAELDLYLPVRLGPRALLWDVAFEGNEWLVESQLFGVSELSLGGPVSRLELEEARRRIVERYADDGYAFAGVEVDVELSPDRTHARARFIISERQPVRLTDVVVEGARFTARDVILQRAALRPGELYRRSRVRATEERLATLGVFTSVTVDLEDPEVPARQKVAIIRVQERLPQYLDVRPGFSTGQGLRVAFEYGHRNLASQAIRMLFRVQLGYLPPPLILDDGIRERFQEVLDQESILFLLQRRNSATLEFPEVGLGPLFRLSFEGLDVRDISRDFAIEKRAAIATLSYRPGRSFNVSLGAGIELNEADLFADLEGLVDFLQQNPGNRALRNLLNIPAGLTLAASQRLGVTWDRRDNSVAATRGTLVSINVEHVNAFELVETAASSTDLGGAFKSHFLQHTGRVAGYLRLSEGGMALATSFRWGYNQQLVSGSQTYPDRLFFLGGVDSLRGFPLWSLIPEDFAAARSRSGGDLSTDDIPVRGGDLLLNPRVELRIPVIGAWQTAVFVDTGNLWLDAAEVTRELRLRYTAGLGVRFQTPVGPLVFDYGFNLAPRASEPNGAFHFSIGLF